jgi:tetratricopeptide (TPR) repeat protein
MPEPSESFDALFEAGQRYAQARRHAEALAPLERALRLRPRSEKAFNLLGLMHFRLDHYREAEEIYRALVQNNPQVHTLHLNLGLVYIKMNRLNEAEAHLTKALTLEPRHVKASMYLGLVYERRGELGRALECYEKSGADKQANRIRKAFAERAEQAPGPSGADTLKVRVPREEDILGVEQPLPAAQDSERRESRPSAGKSQVRVFDAESASHPRGFAFFDRGHALRVSVEKHFYASAGNAAAVAGWLRASHAAFSPRLIRLEGSGQIFFTAPPERSGYLLAGGFDAFHVLQDALWGMSGGLEGAERAFGERAFLVVSGEGVIAVASRARPAVQSLEVLPFQTPVSRVLGWACAKPPEIASRHPLLPHNEPVLRFIAAGMVLLGEP